MTKEELFRTLNYVDATREKRLNMSKRVLEQPQLLKPLIQIAFEEDNPISCKAAWVLEFVTKQKLSLIFPHLDFFMNNINKLHLESSVRPVAKICEELVLNHFSKNKITAQEELTIKHLEKITAACFDWLIGNFKVAPKAYAMTTLLKLGEVFDWIHPELRLILEQNYHTGSAAYKARARMVLKKLE
ncbi:adenylosuccinate lyase [Costertonia aggregata]|uniref:Adenylosuccinate lyase n=1 Tax=Costertonia aggregata TaxID=343403 RepID=A0A7H9AKA8_9FLAO|nr:adenylosuccinate lyase [Costertonia aggregata]QLG43910.1 adenylosuccinate lyase [Costertonia aggregata]